MEANKPLKYLGYAIVFEEVPDEISIAFNISGCEHRCEGCHSKYLWDYSGKYIKDDLENIIKKYEGLITCVCFLGGDQNIDELIELCLAVKKLNLKTCVYSGENSANKFMRLINNDLLDYLKIGEYMSKYGGLKSKHTNQKMYSITNKIMFDITDRFHN